MWYISAMNSRGLVVLAALLALASAPAWVGAQANSQTDSVQSGSSTHRVPAQPSARPDCNGVPCEDQQPRFIVTLPAPAPAPWPLHDRIAWAAYLVLAIVGYVGIMLAVSALKKIERHTAAAETAALAAADAARAALLHAQLIVNAERPWLTVGVEPTPGVENSFNVTATNRGRSPALLTSMLDQSVFALDEAHLPAAPTWNATESNVPSAPIVVLPGEFVSVKTIKRGDASALCGSEEKFKSIESWNERLYLYGKVEYNDLISPPGNEAHETGWCCWYIHGRQKSGLAIAGPPEYHAHT
jgi:hypothetical protein